MTSSTPELTLAHPLRWLALGARDLARAPGPGLSHGLTLALFGAFVFGLLRDRFWALAGAFSGFLLVAPVLATGLYAVSRSLEHGESTTLAHTMKVAIRAWWPRGAQARRMMHFGALLALAGTGWVLTSASFVTGFTPAPVNSPADFVRHVVLAEHGFVFETWVLLGGALAAPIFASSVVAIPMLLDRPVRVWDAVLASWRVVLAHPLPMALWAVLVMGLTTLGMATFLVGLVPIVPWLAHASWHAYRDCVGT
ncbi:MAG: DUF2189 domain-containing protein [Aquincola sp.]|nr:DUF2189 domain-containing protein [Aquincola sp.]MDH4289613.1 DUF2189 domain-containing protein [Aquincola sp.]